MAPNAVMQQQETHDFLMKVDSNLRELSRKAARASEASQKGLDATRSWQEVAAVLDRLQTQRTSIRERCGKKNLPSGLQGRLAAARTRIEAELRKVRAMEEQLTTTTQPDTSCGSSGRGSEDSSSGSAASSPRSSPEEGSAPERGQTSGPSTDSTAEVKVFAEQLLDTAADGEVAAEFVCKICQIAVVGCKPKLTRCSHLFCGDCIDTWFAVQPGSQSWAGRAKGAGTVPCPVCKEPLRAGGDLHEVCAGGEGGSGFLWEMLCATPVVCANHPRCSQGGRCDWQGTYRTFQDHIKVCRNEQCFHTEAAEAVAVEAESTPEACAGAAEEASQLEVESEEADLTPTAASADEAEASASHAEPVPEEASLATLIAQLLELKAPDGAAASGPAVAPVLAPAMPLEAPASQDVVVPELREKKEKRERKRAPKADRTSKGSVTREQEARIKQHEEVAAMRAAQVTQMMQMRMYQAQVLQQAQAMQMQAVYAQQAQLAYVTQLAQLQASQTKAKGRPGRF